MSHLTALAERLHSLVSRRSPGNRPVTKRQTCHAPCIDAADHVAQPRQRMIVLVHRLLPFVAVAIKTRLREQIGTASLDDAQRPILKSRIDRGDARAHRVVGQSYLEPREPKLRD